MKIDYSRLPEHMQASTRRYIEEGYPIGGFMTALFSNDLMESFGRADEINRAAMSDWVRFIYNDAPLGCHGSRELVREWHMHSGIRGLVDHPDEPDPREEDRGSTCGPDCSYCGGCS